MPVTQEEIGARNKHRQDNAGPFTNLLVIHIAAISARGTGRGRFASRGDPDAAKHWNGIEYKIHAFAQPVFGTRRATLDIDHERRQIGTSGKNSAFRVRLR